MAWPEGVVTREITAGQGLTIERGESMSIGLVVRSERDVLVWAGDGSRLVRDVASVVAGPGTSASVVVPVTDQDGWVDGQGRTIDISEPGSYTHRYRVEIYLRDAAGREVRGSRAERAIIVPTGEGPLDIDLGIDAGSVPGEAVAIPPDWWEIPGRAVDAAERAEQARDEAEAIAAAPDGIRDNADRAEAAQAAAETAQADAESARDAAAGSASDASGQASTAGTAASAAGAARDDAIDARDDAVAAKDTVETAIEQLETVDDAVAAAETARDDAVAAEQAASQAASSASSAATSAGDARDEAVSALSGAEDAEQGAQLAQAAVASALAKLPKAMAANVHGVAAGADGETVSLTVTLPDGQFTETPVVTVSPQTQVPSSRAVGIWARSAESFTYYLGNVGASGGVTVYVNWIAVQMS